MPTIPAHAYAYAATFRLKDLVPAFAGAEVTIDKDRLVAKFAAEGHPAIAFAFDFGSLVLVGLDGPERDKLLRAISARMAPEPHAPLTEDYLLEVRPGVKAEVHFERVIVPEATLPYLEIISLLLAQSATLDYYEEDVQDILKRTDAISTGLQVRGRLPGRVPDLIRFIGTCIATKNDVIASLALFDKPDSTWEDADLDRLYKALRLELEIDDRFRALEAKLRMIQENLVLLVDLSQHRSTWRLEVTVVLLILFEVLLTLWQMWKGRGHV